MIRPNTGYYKTEDIPRSKQSGEPHDGGDRPPQSTIDSSRRCKGCLVSSLLGLSCSMNCNLPVACMLAAIAAPVECNALRADPVRSICIALQDSVLIVARIWIVWSLILTIRVGIKLRTISRFRDHSLCHYRSCKGYKQNCSGT